MIDHRKLQLRHQLMLPLICLLLLICLSLSEMAGLQAFADKTQVNDAVPLLITLELPRLKVAEYHRPYVAVWIEDESRALVQHVSVWYQQGANNEGHGEKWLPDLRQWWRRGGRKMDNAVDAVSGATRAVGKHDIRVTDDQLKMLKAGDYSLVVEVAREVGGRELVRIPFTWPTTKSEQAQIAGKSELGQVSIQFTPPDAD